VTVLVRWIAVPAVVETWNPHEAHPRSPRRRQRPGVGVSATRAAGTVRPAMSRDTRPDTPGRPPRCQSAAATRVVCAARTYRACRAHRRRRHGPTERAARTHPARSASSPPGATPG